MMNNPYNDPGVYEQLEKDIFDRLYRIRTKRIWTYTTMDYEVFGIPTSGVRELDNLDMNEWVMTLKTINDLTEMYEQGKEFYFVDNCDIEVAFNSIVDYTNYAANFINNSYHLSYVDTEENEPLQKLLNDLVKMQNLANRIFPVMTMQPNFTQESKGLLGFLSNRRHRQGIKLMNFDPILKYGFTEQDYQDPNRYNDRNAEFRAIDIRENFNPNVARFVGGI